MINLYSKSQTALQTRWVSFENPDGSKGQAAKSNRGAKGHPAERLAPRQTKILLDVKGSGTICRIWMTISNRSPNILRSLRLDIYWEGASTPAVSAPLGDFFGCSLGRRAPFQCDLFSDAEGRSFNCFIPMPFRKSARMTLTNESDELLTHLFYDVNLLMNVDHSENMLYFHTHWRRESPNRLGQDFELLPLLRGNGRFLGCNIGVITSQVYEGTWWGEGEFKVWIDGDSTHPTLCGTGVEDYIGTAWGLGTFAHRTQGCLIADPENRQWSFYRHHLDDPIYFEKDCRITIQTIGGGPKNKVLELLNKEVPLQAVTIDDGGIFLPLLEHPTNINLKDPSLPEGWCNFFRQDDWSSTAYFYLDQPENGLPPLVSDRAYGLLQSANTMQRLDI